MLETTQMPHNRCSCKKITSLLHTAGVKQHCPFNFHYTMYYRQLGHTCTLINEELLYLDLDLLPKLRQHFKATAGHHNHYHDFTNLSVYITSVP